jgi:hypothetical protein
MWIGHWGITESIVPQEPRAMRMGLAVERRIGGEIREAFSSLLEQSDHFAGFGVQRLR